VRALLFYGGANPNAFTSICLPPLHVSLQYPPANFANYLPCSWEHPPSLQSLCLRHIATHPRFYHEDVSSKLPPALRARLSALEQNTPLLLLLLSNKQVSTFFFFFVIALLRSAVTL
jgi:hypothetical protein